MVQFRLAKTALEPPKTPLDPLWDLFLAVFGPVFGTFLESTCSDLRQMRTFDLVFQNVPTFGPVFGPYFGPFLTGNLAGPLGSLLGLVSKGPQKPCF